MTDPSMAIKATVQFNLFGGECVLRCACVHADVADLPRCKIIDGVLAASVTHQQATHWQTTQMHPYTLKQARC